MSVYLQNHSVSNVANNQVCILVVALNELLTASALPLTTKMLNPLVFVTPLSSDYDYIDAIEQVYDRAVSLLPTSSTPPRTESSPEQRRPYPLVQPLVIPMNQ